MPPREDRAITERPAPPPAHLSFARRNEQGFEEHTLDKDPSVRLIWIPGGSFAMGGDDRRDAAHEPPRIRLSGYFFATTPVTQAQYARYCADEGIARPESPRWGRGDDHPVVNVSWGDALGYCAWAGLQLPSEAQWEYAARATDGRTYPWGNTKPTRRNRRARMRGTGDGTSPVTAHPKGVGPFGTLGQAGNVWEWCRDYWSPHGPVPPAPALDPPGPDRGAYRVARGGCWQDIAEAIGGISRHRVIPARRFPILGFRPALLP